MTRSRLHPAAILLLSSLVSCLYAIAVSGQNRPAERPQRPGDSPAVRVTASTVLVDVVVTDEHNRPVTDLRLEDFEIWDEGVARPVDYVWLVSPGVADVAGVASPARPAGYSLREPAVVHPPQLVIFLLDHASLDFGNQPRWREALQEYVQTRMGGNVEAAVFQVGRTFRLLQNFTSDRRALMRAFDLLDPTGTAYAGDQAFLTSLAEESRESVETLGRTIDELVGLGPEAGPQARALVEQLLRQMRAAEAREALYLGQRSYSRELQARVVLRAIQEIARALRPLAGRKTLVLVSEGFAVPAQVDRLLHECLEAANAARLAIYAIDGAGLEYRQPSERGQLFEISALRSGDRKKAYGGLSQFDHAHEVGADVGKDTLRHLAAATGGKFVRFTNDFLSAVEGAIADAGTHYLLAFRPAGPSWDGRYHALEVKLRRPGLRVRARPGYWSLPPAASFLTGEEFRRLVFDGAAERRPAPAFRVAVQTAVFPRSADRVPVFLEVEVPTQGLATREEDGATVLECRLVGIVRDTEGGVVASFRGPDRVAMARSAADVPPVLRWCGELELPAGDYSVGILVEDAVGGRWVRVARGLRVVGRDGGWALSDVVVGLPDAGAQPGTLSFRGETMGVVPLAERTFDRRQPLAFFVEAYRPADGASGAAPRELEVALVRGAHRAVLSREPLPAEPREPLRIARWIRLDGLSSGRYRLAVTLVDSEQGRPDDTAVASFVIR
ncbi:MAG: hypothetical protein Kow00109_26150 [Acidobacteriota bacterium]